MNDESKELIRLYQEFHRLTMEIDRLVLTLEIEKIQVAYHKDDTQWRMTHDELKSIRVERNHIDWAISNFMRENNERTI